MTQILLVGTDLPLLEGLAQSLAGAGHNPQVAGSMAEAREIALATRPLIAVVSRQLGADAPGELLGIPVSPGGAIVLYRTIGSLVLTLPANVQRAVLADLTLPLERNRLLALVQHVEDRAKATGRAPGWDDENPSVSP